MSTMTLRLRALHPSLLAVLNDDFVRRVEHSNCKYPVSNIYRIDEENFRIDVAVTGFRQDELSIDHLPDINRVQIVGKREAREHEQNATYFQRQLSTKDFKRHFDLPEHVKPIGSKLEDGILSIELKLELPEASRPQSIPIG